MNKTAMALQSNSAKLSTYLWIVTKAEEFAKCLAKAERLTANMSAGLT